MKNNLTPAHPILENVLGYLLNTSLTRLRHRLLKTLSPHGIKLNEWFVLMSLFENDGQSVSSLLEPTMLHQPTLTKILRRLEDKGLLRRKLDPKDKRISQNFISKKGGQIVKSVMVGIHDVENVAFQDFKKAEIKIFELYIRKIIYNLKG